MKRGIKKKQNSFISLVVSKNRKAFKMKNTTFFKNVDILSEIRQINSLEANLFHFVYTFF